MWTGSGPLIGDVSVKVDAGRIVSLEPNSRPSPREIRLPGITLPGLANAHSHAFHRALRGRTHSGRGDFWAWRQLMYEVAGRLDPDSYFALGRAVYAEMALAGVTAVGEFHYLHHDPSGRPYSDPNAMGRALVAGAASAGIKITLIDTCYLHGGFSRPLEGVQKRFGDADVDAWAQRAGDFDADSGPA
ncbi:MAG: amidohydrolase family protein, partial [Actinobacteria bacterium]|nr:amidohydrolase family protein [Actinomycetota bacterium]